MVFLNLDISTVTSVASKKKISDIFIIEKRISAPISYIKIFVLAILGGGAPLNPPVKIYNSKNALQYFDFCVA